MVMKYLPDTPKSLDTKTLKRTRRRLMRVMMSLQSFSSSSVKVIKRKVTKAIRKLDRELERRGVDL